MTKFSLNAKVTHRQRVYLSHVALQHHCREVEWLQMRETGSPWLFSNCLANFNRNHLSVSAAERQPVEILTSRRTVNTSHSTTSIHCSNLPVHTQTHTYVWHDCCHTLWGSSLPAFPLSKEMLKKREKGWLSSTGEESGRWDAVTAATTLPTIHHTQHPISLFYHI